MPDPHATPDRAAKGGMRYPDPGTEPHDFPDETDFDPNIEHPVTLSRPKWPSIRVKARLVLRRRDG